MIKGDIGVGMSQKLEQIPTPPALHSKDGVIAVIAAFNEDRFIGSVVLKTLQYAANVIVVDDGSQDQTALVSEQAGAIVIRHPDNQGKTSAVQTGLHKACEYKPCVVVVLDGDGQHHPQDIPALVQPILAGEAQIVVGSRFLSKRDFIPRWRIFGQHSLTLATNLLSGFPLSDSQSGFRAFAPEVLDQLRFRRSGFSFESEMQFLAREKSLTIKEIPIGVTYAEKSKRSPVKHGLQVVNSILALVGQNRPLLFFGVPGALILLAGVGIGAYVVKIYQKVQQLAVGYAILSVLLSIVGMLLLSNGVILHSIRGLLMDIKSHLKD
jgi:glycosyltransferase involved in cell wall biosynthesis